MLRNKVERLSIVLLIVLLHSASSIAGGFTERSVSPKKFNVEFKIALEEEDLVITKSGLKDAAISPDGNKIAFSAGSKNKQSLWIFDMVTKEIKEVLNNSFDNITPDWTPDNSNIIYSCNKTGTYEIWAIDIKSGEQRQISNLANVDKKYPKSSPISWNYNSIENHKWNKSYSGYAIIYESIEQGITNINLMGSDGSAAFVVTDAVRNAKNAEWAPFGLSVVYNLEDAGKMKVLEGWGFKKYRYDNTAKKSIEEAILPEIKLGQDAFYPQYLPNQTKLIFLESKEKSKRLYYCDVDGTNINYIETKRIINDRIALSPNGNYFLYTSGNNLYLQYISYPLYDVTNLWQYGYINAAQISKLEQNNFVVSGKEYSLFSTPYELAIYNESPVGYSKPVFITADSVLELFHLFFDYSMKTLEEQKLSAKLENLTGKLASITASNIKDYPQDVTIQGDLLKILAFLETANKILNDSYQVNTLVVKEVEKEMELINAHTDMAALSPIFNQAIDYTQFTVRGHYTANEKLSRYFKAMIWLGQVKFRADITKVLPEERELVKEETREALIITYLLSKNPDLNKLWDELYAPILIFVGGADDLKCSDYVSIGKTIYKYETIGEFYDESKLSLFLKEVAKKPYPKIQPQFGQSFRFMPQRFTPDSYILQELVYRKVGDETNPRWLPKGLDILSVLGSDRAAEILDRVLNETKYKNYSSQINSLKKEFSAVTEEDWWQNIYWGWLFTLKSFVPQYGEDYPLFMRNSAWLDKNLVTALASWTELRHDTILYVKAFCAERGEGGAGWVPIVPKPKGYVEPNLEFFKRMSKLISIAYTSLKSRDLISEELAVKFVKFSSLVTKLQILAQKEYNKVAITDEEYKFIMNYGAELEYLSLFLAGSEESFGNTGQIALVADVGMGGGQILHEAVGRVKEINVIVPIENRKTLTMGGVFTYYEFPVQGHRLNDEIWQKQLAEKNAPAMPVWTNTYIAP